MTAATYKRYLPCIKCGNHQHYKRSGNCVYCVAVRNKKYQAKCNVVPMDRRNLERLAMAGARYENESGALL